MIRALEADWRGIGRFVVESREYLSELYVGNSTQCQIADTQALA